MLHFASKDVTFPVTVTFGASCYILRRNSVVNVHIQSFIKRVRGDIQIVSVHIGVKVRLRIGICPGAWPNLNNF